MDKRVLEELLEQLAAGTMAPAAAMERLRDLPFEDIEFAKIDFHRSLRQGLPEVVFCPGKTDQQIVSILECLSAHHRLVLATRCSAESAYFIKNALPSAEYHASGRIISIGMFAEPREQDRVAVVTAGTADISVAEEACITLLSAGIIVERYFDVGVAGIHRLLNCIGDIRKCSMVIVIAGMDGVLPSVVAGLLSKPIVAVPTSIGYGASFGGVGALLTMLNSCAAGLTVVNIDNGFGAAVSAIRTLSLLGANRVQRA